MLSFCALALSLSEQLLAWAKETAGSRTLQKGSPFSAGEHCEIVDTLAYDNALAIFFAQVERFDGRKLRSCAVDSIYVAEQFTPVLMSVTRQLRAAGVLPSIFEWDMYRS
jgi:hypothetical protein